MQALWSRAAQTRATCRCSTCIHTSTSVARRTATATSTRGVKASDVFTACYSTILATAAIADARIKDDRIKEWDRVIAEAKAGRLEDQHLHGRTDTEAIPEPTFSARAETTFSVHKSPVSEREPETQTWHNKLRQATFPPTQESGLEIKLRALGSQIKQSLECSVEISGPDHEPAAVSGTLLYNEFVGEQPDIELGERNPRTLLHLSKLEGVISTLVEKLLLKIDLFSLQTQHSNSEHARQMKKLAADLTSLRAGFTQLPNYRWESPESVEKERTVFHTSLNTLCRNAEKDHAPIDLMIAKICYNLLVSTVPANIHTYNILIDEFCKRREHDITQVVVNSLLHDGRFKPSKKTIHLVLDHYIAKDDPVGFQAIVSRMNGSVGDMRIKRMPVYALNGLRTQRWVAGNQVIHRGSYYVQKAPRDTRIFDSLIRGALQLKGVRPAIRYLRAAFREGKKVQEETFSAVVAGCLAIVDYRAGMNLLRAVLLLWKEDKLSSVLDFSEDVRDSFYHLVSLCGLSISPDAKERVPNTIGREHLQSFLRCLQSLEYGVSEAEGTGNIAHVVSTTSMALARIDQGRNYHHAEWSRNSRLLAAKREEHAAQCRALRLLVLDLKITTQRERFVAHETELLSILYNSLSKQQQEKYNMKMRTYTRMTISGRLALIAHLHGNEQKFRKKTVIVSNKLLKTTHLHREGKRTHAINDLVAEQSQQYPDASSLSPRCTALPSPFTKENQRYNRIPPAKPSNLPATELYQPSDVFSLSFRGKDNVHAAAG